MRTAISHQLLHSILLPDWLRQNSLLSVKLLIVPGVLYLSAFYSLRLPETYILHSLILIGASDCLSGPSLAIIRGAAGCEISCTSRGA